MNPIVKNILAVLAGVVIGNVVNMGFIELGNIVVPIEGVDVSDMEALKKAMPDFGVENFIFPFLAHALGTLVGAYIAARLAATHKMKFAMGIGVFFLIGGIAVNMMLPGPIWFTIMDIALAYIPMAYIGGTLAIKHTQKA
ncbi:hypothetical protein BST92_09895 [Nonlabens arenilitoris]|uniref:Uncharacterized protein n=1 Tax=Nonlabens arenilitoris TaxID=1217969 RepID=A0A2S7UBA9_9FLAO|nr:hypothetical protein [Nonlabens arenilitoris]PQJ32218.1 hypothetical protein BST92_09895 [Nonlabens arenilitoris]